MLYTPLTKRALTICFEAHKNQKDKSDAPYVFHPFHLAEQMQTESEVCVALLHDVVEDTQLTGDDLRAAGMPDDIVEAVELLTHDASEPYMDYVARIAQNPLAARVKRADLTHNSDLSRFDGEPSERDMERREKYLKAISLLNRACDRTRCNSGSLCADDSLPMFGAIVGDIVGSVYEWDNIKTMEFPLFSDGSTFTDDSVMTVAVAQALLEVAGSGESRRSISRPKLRETVVSSMQDLGRRYPRAGYGGSFRKWLRTHHPTPYNSWGNGSAMRVSPVAWAASSVEEAEFLAAASAEVTHNHPEGIKGAQAAAACIFLARMGSSNEEIRHYVEVNHGYDLGFTLDDIREEYKFDVSCQGSVPHAIVAFLESSDFEDAVRRAVSIGGDSDTIAAITGGIAQARYGVPGRIAFDARRRLPEDFLTTIDAFCECLS